MERFANRGGNYNNTSNAGPSYCNFNNRRSNTNAFRPVFVGSLMYTVQGPYTGAFDKKSLVPSCKENKHFSGRPVGILRPPYRSSFIVKTYTNLWSRIIDFESLLAAYRRASKCKRYTRDVLMFTENLEENLIQLQNEMVWKMYQPTPPREFYITVPKRRLIAAPAFRDRVVHHALCAVIEPLLERRFIFDSYACRLGKGNHAGVARLQYFEKLAHEKWGSYYAYKGDIKGYFPSIPHDILKRVIRSTIADRDVLDLLDTIIDSSGVKGLPIGALTSQLMANLYLDNLDHFVKETLQCKFYLRYMDDFVVLVPRKEEAKDIESKISLYVEDVLSLEMNPKSGIVKESNGIHFCGFRVWPTHILPAKPAFRRAVRRLKHLANQYGEGKISQKQARQSVMSFIAHYKHSNSQRSVQSALDKIVFKGAGYERDGSKNSA